MAKITISTNDNLVVREYEVLLEDLIPEEWPNTSLSIKLALREALLKEDGIDDDDNPCSDDYMSEPFFNE